MFLTLSCSTVTNKKKKKEKINEKNQNENKLKFEKWFVLLMGKDVEYSPVILELKYLIHREMVFQIHGHDHNAA